MTYNPRLIIYITIFIALCFQIMPWPTSIMVFKPNLLILFLSYWIIALPHQIRIGTAFLFGTILDLFMSSPLGVHAFVLSIIAYLALFKAQIIKNLALWQQSLIIASLSLCYSVLLLLFEIIIYRFIFMSPTIFLSCIIDGLLWVPIYLILQLIKNYFHVE